MEAVLMESIEGRAGSGGVCNVGHGVSGGYLAIRSEAIELGLDVLLASALTTSHNAAAGAGTHMTVEELVARQTRIERQETPHVASASFERHAADAFQSYVHGAIAFSIKRGGLLYGTVDDEGRVLVEAIYEPPQVPAALEMFSRRAAASVKVLRAHAAIVAVPAVRISGMEVHRRSAKPEQQLVCLCADVCYACMQSGSAESLQLERGTDEEERADFVAKQLG